MVLIILLCILLFLFGGSYYAYRIAFFSPKKDREAIRLPNDTQYDPYRDEMIRLYQKLKERPYETVTTFSHDGLLLSGRYYHVKDDAPVDIGFHGYKSHSITDFSGGSELSFQMEHNLLLVDQRARGNSEGHSITFGIQERLDVLSWIYFARNHFGADTKILLYGVSMGASTVLMAAGLQLPENVKGIIADSPYASPIDIILDVAKRRTLAIPFFLVKPFVILGAKIYGGFDIQEANVITAIKNSKVPILIIHGEADLFVPCEMSDIAIHCPDKITRYTFPDAAHGVSYLVDRTRYQHIVQDFLEKIL